MVDFSNLTALSPDADKTKTYVFDELKGKPSVISRPATKVNGRYNDARLKRLNKRLNGGRKKLVINAETIEQSRVEDAELMAKYCAVSWGTAPIDANGEAVQFTAKNCYDFFLAIPEEMFTDYRTWVQDNANFTGDEDGFGEGDSGFEDAEGFGEALTDDEVGKSTATG